MALLKNSQTNWKYLLIIAVLALVIIGICWRQKDNIERLIFSNELPDSWRACSVDSDCIETQASCCNCNNGGIQTGINKKYSDTWKAKLAVNCQQIGCIALFNCKEGNTICRNKKCEFVPKEEETADWQTYRNEKQGYEVRYPNDWEYLSCMEGIQFELYSPNNPVGNCDEPRFNSNFSIIGPGSPPGNIKYARKVETIILNSIEAKKYIDVPMGQIGELLEDGIVITKDSKTFYIALESKKEYSYIFDQILSTFKFIEPEPYIKIISPNGGETWKVNESHTIKWQEEGLENWGDVVTICLSAFDSNGNENEAKEEENSRCYFMHGHDYFINEATLSKKEYKWTIPEYIFGRFIPSPTSEEPSLYKISVSVFDHLPATGRSEWAGLIADDESDDYFRIVSE